MAKLLTFLRMFPPFAAIAVILMGGFVAAGWITESLSIVQVGSRFIPMQIDDGILFILCGFSLYFATEKEVKLTHALAYIGVLFCVLNGLLFSLGHEQGLFGQFLTFHSEAFKDVPFRINLASIFCLFLVSTQLSLVKRIKQAHWTMHYVVSTAAIVLSVSSATLVQHLIEPESSFVLAGIGTISIHVAVGLFLFSIGTIGLFLRTWQKELDSANLTMFIAVVSIALTLVFWQVTSSNEYARTETKLVNQLNKFSNDVARELELEAIELTKVRYLIGDDQAKLAELQSWNRKLSPKDPNLLLAKVTDGTDIQHYSSDSHLKRKFDLMYEESKQLNNGNWLDNTNKVKINLIADSYTAVYISQPLIIGSDDAYFLIYLTHPAAPNDLFFGLYDLAKFIAPVLSRNKDALERIKIALNEQVLFEYATDKKQQSEANSIIRSRNIEHTNWQVQIFSNSKLLGLNSIGKEVLLFSILFCFLLIALTYQYFSHRHLAKRFSKESQIRGQKLLELRDAKLTVDLATKVSHLGVWSWRMDSGELEWNDNMYEIYEVPHDIKDEALTYEVWESSLHPEDKETAVESLQSAINKGEDWNDEFRLFFPGGKVKYVLAHATFTKDQYNQPSKMIGGNIDITELREAQNKLVELKELADRSNVAKSQFLANMSHEIRTPMNGVIGITGLLNQTKLSSLQQEYLQLIANSADSLLRLLNDLLDHSKIEAGMLEIHQEPFALDHQIGDVMKGFAPTAHQKMLDLQFYIDKDVPSCVISDPMRIGQIVFNLVGNAIKFTDSGQVTVNVDINEDDVVIEEQQIFELQIKVQDTGIGIAEDKIETILEPFAQADTTTTRRYGGTGLGLPIVNQLIKLMSGKLEIESDLNVGSTFTVTLPVKKGSETLLRDSIVHSHVINKYDFSGISCLVVDDNPLNRKWLESMLSSWGCKVELSDSAEMAMSYMEEHGESVDIMVIDKDMPEVDGFELIDKMKEKFVNPPMIVMMLHTNDIQNEMDRIKENNIKHYLFKPVKQSEVFNIIAQILDVERPDLKSSEQQELPLPNRLLNVLVAEDNPINSRLVNDILTYRGHNATLVFNGMQAVDKFKSEKFDIVLMDVQMPEMDGLEATRAMRKIEAQQELAPTVIVGLTAHALRGDRQVCIDAGMDDYLTKPVDSQKLLMLIESFQLDPFKMQDNLDFESDTNLQKGQFLWLDESSINKVTSGQKEIISRMLEMTLELLPNDIDALEQAYAQKDWNEIPQLVHKLKGMLGNVTGLKLQEDFEELERLAKEGEEEKYSNAWLRTTLKLKVLLQEIEVKLKGSSI